MKTLEIGVVQSVREPGGAHLDEVGAQIALAARQGAGRRRKVAGWSNSCALLPGHWGASRR